MDPTPRACTQATRAADVWRQLAGVNDPELDESLVDLGFVAGVDIDDGDVTVRFRLPTYWCAPNFAYMMAQDIRDQVSELAWVSHVSVRLVDHCTSDAISDGITKGWSFEQIFPAEATGDLAELRRVFRRKAFMTRQERLLKHLGRAGWSAAALVCLRVQELHEAADLGPEGDRLRARYLGIREELGLPVDAAERAITTVDGEAVTLESFEAYLRELRKCRLNMEINTDFCRGLLMVRYGLATDAD